MCATVWRVPSATSCTSSSPWSVSSSSRAAVAAAAAPAAKKSDRNLLLVRYNTRNVQASVTVMYAIGPTLHNGAIHVNR